MGPEDLEILRLVRTISYDQDMTAEPGIDLDLVLCITYSSAIHDHGASLATQLPLKLNLDSEL